MRKELINIYHLGQYYRGIFVTRESFVCLCVCVRERETDRETQREKDTEREGDREGERERKSVVNDYSWFYRQQKLVTNNVSAFILLLFGMIIYY